MIYFRSIAFIIIVVVIFYFMKNDLDELKAMLYKFAVDAIIGFFVFGIGILSLVKITLFTNYRKIYDYAYYRTNSEKLSSHEIFTVLKTSRHKQHSDYFKNTDTIILFLQTVMIEFKICQKYLIRTNEQILRSYDIDFDSNRIIEIFKNEFVAEREIVYDMVLKMFIRQDIENANKILSSYRFHIEAILEPIYRNFSLLVVKKNKYPPFLTIEIIFNSFWQAFLSIDSDIAYIYQKVEKDIKKVECSNV